MFIRGPVTPTPYRLGNQRQKYGQIVYFCISAGELHRDVPRESAYHCIDTLRGRQRLC